MLCLLCIVLTDIKSVSNQIYHTFFLMQEVIHYIMLNHILWLKLWWYYNNVFCYILSYDIASCCQMVCYTILYRLHIILQGSMLTQYINIHIYIYIYMCVCDNMHYIISYYTILISYFIRLEPWYMICDELFLLTLSIIVLNMLQCIT